MRPLLGLRQPLPEPAGHLLPCLARFGQRRPQLLRLGLCPGLPRPRLLRLGPRLGLARLCPLCLSPRHSRGLPRLGRFSPRLLHLGQPVQGQRPRPGHGIQRLGQQGLSGGRLGLGGGRLGLGGGRLGLGGAVPGRGIELLRPGSLRMRADAGGEVNGRMRRNGGK